MPDKRPQRPPPPVHRSEKLESFMSSLDWAKDGKCMDHPESEVKVIEYLSHYIKDVGILLMTMS